MNLIMDAWIPIRRKSGKKERISPWQLTDGIVYDPPTALASPRPDFDGALIQFLIALLQTTLAPNTPIEWRQSLKHPPSCEVLKRAFEPIAFAFELDGDGPRFMQELAIERDKRWKKNPVYELMIEVPTGKTLRENADHFVKRGGIERICSSCAATALFTLQVNAHSGGRGYRAGLRGGGPLTTIIVADTLWATCWQNVLEKPAFLQLANPDKSEPKDRFPWLAEARTSEGGEVVTPLDVHPDQIYWSMPRRLRLIFTEEPEEESCDLCGANSKYTVKSILVKIHGINYKSSWRHPLSPYRIDKSGNRMALRPMPDGIAYRDWLGLVQSTADNKERREPALVVQQYIQRYLFDREMQLWAFGFDTDKKKVRGWYEGMMPLVTVPCSIRKPFEAYTASLVLSAELVADALKERSKEALFKRSPDGKAKGDLSFIKLRFWRETEAEFYESLRRLRDALTNKDDILPILEAWHAVLRRSAEEIFYDVTQIKAFDPPDPKRVAQALLGLRKAINGRKIRQLLHL